MQLSQSSDHTMEVIGAALDGLREIYRCGFQYRKEEWHLRLQYKGTIQATLFDDTEQQAKSTSMMPTMDAINRKMGKGSVTLAASGKEQRLAMHRGRYSQNFTTDWSELMVAGEK